MRASISRVRSSKRACSSGVIFRGLFFLSIVAVLQKCPYLVHVSSNVTEHDHDSREVSIVDRHSLMVAVAVGGGK